MSKHGVITEQGDLGLGWDELSEEDDQAVKESLNEEKDKEKK